MKPDEFKAIASEYGAVGVPFGGSETGADGWVVTVQVGDYVIRDVFWPEDMTTMPEDYLRHILGQHKEHLEGK